MRNNYRLFGIIIFTFLCSFSIEARHIIGGELTYTCLGDDNYRFRMTIYRDCQGGGAQFDSAPGAFTLATVTLYRGTSLVNTSNLPAPDITRIPPVVNPCLVVPSGVCVESGVYSFTMNLPEGPESYTVVYQRCCRNNSISNIIGPGEIGATYFIELTPRAQEICNTSPSFINFPDIIVCANEPLVFDHSAIDPDNNTQLIYEFCTPLKGGGLRGLQDPREATRIDGIAPNPDAPPPYEAVDYINPPYSFFNPLSPAANLQINPNTGLITGRPMINGQFVVGVCVKEIFNGEVISEVRRDFQYNVTTCEKKVFAGIEADEELGAKEFFVRSCGNNTVDIINESFQEQFIDTYDWEFDISGSVETYTTRDVSVTFPDTGLYMGRLFLNRGAEFANCKDSIDIKIGVYGAIQPDFTFQYDSCAEGIVKFESLAKTENQFITNHDWEFGDGGLSQAIDPEHSYSQGNSYDVKLMVTDNKGCIGDVIKPLPYYPVPDLVLAQPSQFRGCVPLEISFSSLNEVLTDEYEITWTFSDGGRESGLNVSHLFENVGLFDAEINVLSPLGCETSRIFNSWIDVLPSPSAAFDYTPKSLNQLRKEVNFTNLSKDAVGYQWDFGTGSRSTEVNPQVNFPDTGLYVIELVAFKENGCTDTALARIDINPLNTYFLPNVFTPNGDAHSDDYKGRGLFLGVTNFSFQIWNRWGELVYESDDPYIGWNGRRFNTGEMSPKGVYHCQVSFLTARGDKMAFEESLTLVR